MNKLKIFIVVSIILASTHASYALQDTVSDNFSTQVLVDSVGITGSFDLSYLFSQNVVIDSATVSFSFTDDGDLAYSYSNKTPTVSGDYYNGNYYLFMGESTQGYYKITTFMRSEDQYWEDVQETVTMAINTQSTAVSTTNYFSNSTSQGTVFEGQVQVGQTDGDTQYFNQYYCNSNLNESGYNGDASAQIVLDADAIAYLMANQGIDFTLTCGSGEDILFNSASMDIEYHIEETPEPVAVPEPHTVMLLLSGIAMLVKKLRG